MKNTGENKGHEHEREHREHEETQTKVGRT